MVSKPLDAVAGTLYEGRLELAGRAAELGTVDVMRTGRGGALTMVSTVLSSVDSTSLKRPLLKALVRPVRPVSTPLVGSVRSVCEEEFD